MRERPGTARAEPTRDGTAAGADTGTGGEPTAPEPTEALAALVTKLRSELTGVRTAMRNRAVIEQAKGVLTERLGVTPDESFDHLVRLSQRANIKLIEVAAAIVGTTAPDPQGAPVTEFADEELREHLNRTLGRARAAEVKEPARPGRPTPRGGAAAATGPAARIGGTTPAGTTPAGPPPTRAKAAAKAGAPTAARRPGRAPAHEALQAQHQLISARIAAATTYDEIAEAIGTATAAWPAPATVVITVLGPDGAHRFLGAYGIGAADRSEWARVPPQVDLPITDTVRDRAPLLIADRQTLAERYPNLTAHRYGTASIFAAPLIDDDRVIGALGLSWQEPLYADDDTRRYLSALAAPVARRTAELADQASPATAGPLADLGPDVDTGATTWLPIVLEAVPDPAAVLAPVWADDQVVDFRVEYANEPATRLVAPAPGDDDATLLAAYPRVGSELLLPRFAELLRTGGPVRLGPVRLAVPAAAPHRGGAAGGPAGGGTGGSPEVMTVRASRLWDRVLMVWRVHGEAELLYPQLLDAERIARIGSFSWQLGAAEPRCSPQLYRMYYGDRPGDAQPQPIEVADVAACVHDDDLPALLDAAGRALSGGDQFAWEFRGAGRLSGRRLRVVAAPELDGSGVVTTICGTVQDLTEERAIESRLRLAEEALAAQRGRVDAELRAAQALQRALLPTEPELGTTDGLWISGRCRASEDPGRVDGDWYDACALPGGATLLVVGDVAGSGLAAMTAAARLRYAVRAYAALDMSPGEILGAVNAMLCSLEPERTATLVVARYDSGGRRLRWATAGQAAPVRYQRSGRTELLPGPLGLPVGAAPQVTYQDAEVELVRGDRLLLYTDSLVGGRGTDLVSALDVLLAAGAHAGRDDVAALVSHVVGALYAGSDVDMGALLVRVDS